MIYDKSGEMTTIAYRKRYTREAAILIGYHTCEVLSKLGINLTQAFAIYDEGRNCGAELVDTRHGKNHDEYEKILDKLYKIVKAHGDLSNIKGLRRSTQARFENLGVDTIFALANLPLSEIEAVKAPREYSLLFQNQQKAILYINGQIAQTK